VDKIIIGYCRVSSKTQFNEGHALERYIDALISYGIPPNFVFFDVESGISETREGLNSVLDLVKAGKVSKIVVPNFDRLTRSPAQWESARNLFTEHGVILRFLEDGDLDLNSPDGLFTGRVKAALAAQVRDRLRSHSLAGHARHRERKEPYKPIFGYLKVDGIIVPNQNLYPETELTYFEIARKLIDFFLEIKTYAGTLDEFRANFYMEPPSYNGKIHLKVPTSQTGFKNWLTNAILRGKIQYLSLGRKTPFLIVDGTHEPLMTDDEWITIQSFLENNKNKKLGIAPSKLINALSGVARCKNCGGVMSQKTPWKNKAGEWSRFLVCRNARNKNGKCRIEFSRTYFLTLEVAEKQVQDFLVKKAKELSEIIPAKKTTEYNPKVQELKDSIKNLSSFNDPDLFEVIERKKTQLFSLVESEKIETVSSEDKIKLFKYLQHPDFWETMSVHERNLIYRDTISVVWCDKGSIEVIPNI
jgi:site-specific DNA recombinase